MLTIVVPTAEFFDEANQEFVYPEGATLQLEHSLVAVSKWEAKWKKPFLTNDKRTDAETVDYIRFMCLTLDVDPAVFLRLSQENNQDVADYIQAPMTATWFREVPGSRPGNTGEVITSEVIYYWMISLGVPMECENWHLNRLLTLIRVVNEKNKPKKKMSKSDAAAQRHAINMARRQQTGSNG